MSHIAPGPTLDAHTPNPHTQTPTLDPISLVFLDPLSPPPRRRQILPIPAVPHRPALLPVVTSPRSPSPPTGLSPRPGEPRDGAVVCIRGPRSDILERRALDLTSRALAARADINATHARCLTVACDISSTNSEIEDAQWKAKEWDRFYESKRKEMEDFRAMSQQFEAGAHQEVRRLKAFVSQLQAALQELQSSGLHSDDAGIGAAEARKTDLMAKKAKLDETLNVARQFRALLQQQLQKAFVSQVRDQKAAQN
ncbi:uncharacterized protein LOC119338507 [Triticum dicoccoides]|uniref:uncharacterized protein LOC119338507 n=1 Tax=Triticum dicoccoides TaxID=85692 RepID=UPI001890F7A9|nr:uncharacterized protein LOC119338507 [Triticum dicoccoides]